MPIRASASSLLSTAALLALATSCATDHSEAMARFELKAAEIVKLEEEREAQARASADAAAAEERKREEAMRLARTEAERQELRRQGAIAELAAAVAAGGLEGSRAKFAAAAAEDRAFPGSELGQAITAWVEAPDLGAGLLAYDRVLDAARRQPQAAPHAAAMTTRRGTLRAEALASLPLLLAEGDRAAARLDCGKVAELAKAIASFELATQPESRASLPIFPCRDAADASGRAAAARKFEAAYSIWYLFRSSTGALPTLSAAALRKQATQFTIEAKQTLTEAASQRGIGGEALARRALLGATPALLTWQPTLGPKLLEARQREQARAVGAKKWSELTSAATALVALDRLLGDAGPPPAGQPLPLLLAAAAKGDYASVEPGWKAHETGKSPSLQAVAGRARALAAEGLLATSSARLKAGKILEAAVALHGASLLKPELPGLDERRAALAAQLPRERERLAAILRTANGPGPTHKACADLHALDRATGGPSSALAPEAPAKILATLEAFAAGKIEAAISDVKHLSPGGVDFLQDAVQRLKGWSRTNGLLRARALATAEEYVAAERTAEDVSELVPGDSEVRSLLEALKEPAQRQRSSRVDQLFRGNHVALAYTLTRADTHLAVGDRTLLLQANASQIAALKSSLRLAGVIRAADAFTGALGPAAAGAASGWELADREPAGKPLYRLEVKLRAIRVEAPAPRLARTEPGTTRYRSGTSSVANPARASCDLELEAARTALANAQAGLSTAEVQHQTCLQTANQAASQIGGWGGVLMQGAGGATCNAAIIGTAQSALGEAQGTLQNTTARCAAVPGQLQEDRFDDVPYTIEHWAVEPSAEVELLIEDPAHPGAPLVKKLLAHRFRAEDRVVRGQPQYGLADDPLQLPPQPELERTLVEALAPQVKEAFAAAAGGHWKILEQDATAAGDDAARNEILARIVVLAEITADASPELRQRAEQLTAVIRTAPIRPAGK